jgi:hypothetical protein
MTTSSLKFTPLDYAAHFGLPVFPVALIKQPNGKIDKQPLIKWKEGATRDLQVIEQLWRRYPRAVPGMPTGKPSGINVLDVDTKNPAEFGPDTLEELGGMPLPVVPISHTISCGFHLMFGANPEVDIRNSAGKTGLGPGLDVRGTGGYIVLPAGGPVWVENLGMVEGYRWDDHHHLGNTPLIPAPKWMAHKTSQGSAARHRHGGPFDPRHSLDEHCALIRGAGSGSGERHDTTNRSAFSVGTMVGRSMLDQNSAWASVHTAVGILAHGADDEKALINGAELAFADGVVQGQTRGPWQPRGRARP